MYDPVKKAEETSRVVSRGDSRKYYRFRAARFYGGIATADCVGCCLLCLFCWAWDEVVSPEASGQFYSPAEVAGKLVGIAHRKGFRRLRISGNEPTLARDHLIRVLEQIPPGYEFILETNGILIGDDLSYARDLSRFPFLCVRVSLKGTNEEEFSRLTGADPRAFLLQLKALENLLGAGARAYPAVMVSFSPPENIRSLQERLADAGVDEMEIEELVLYGNVEKRLRKAGIPCVAGYDPSGIPPEQI
ncbi:MAG: radical SAM protein [Deltaproteobacteria bacterium]|nr:radical SAM protein [Deltaproteobacteria bacterium]